MNRSSRLVASSILISALYACGGGGGSDSPAPTPAAAKHTQSDIQNVAHLGAGATISTGQSGGVLMAFLSGFLEAYAIDNGGSRTVAGPYCSSGTSSATVTKSAVRTGLAAGDQVATTFAQCNISGVVINGTVKLTTQVAVTTLSATNFSVNYEAQTSDLSFTGSGKTYKYSGLIDSRASLVAGNTSSAGFTVATGSTFTISMTGGSQPLVLGYGAGTVFEMTDVASSRALTRKLDGPVTLAVGSGSTSLVIATPTALAGSTSSSGVTTISSGVINATSTADNLVTSTTFGSSNATVSGDSDGDSSLDLVFTVPPASLLSL